MSDYAAEKPWKLTRQRSVLEAAFRLFSEKGITSVTMPEVAQAGGVSRATLFRYFPSKLDLVIEVGTWKWAEYIEGYTSTVSPETLEAMTGAEYLRFYLDSFLDLYRNHADILRVNYEFNSFFQHESQSMKMKMPNAYIIDAIAVCFHDLYQRGVQDGTLNTDIPESIMFSSVVHIMLATVTRYAVGLMYMPDGVAPETELQLLRNMLLREFARNRNREIFPENQREYSLAR